MHYANLAYSFIIIVGMRGKGGRFAGGSGGSHGRDADLRKAKKGKTLGCRAPTGELVLAPPPFLATMAAAGRSNFVPYIAAVRPFARLGYADLDIDDQMLATCERRVGQSLERATTDCSACAIYDLLTCVISDAWLPVGVRRAVLPQRNHHISGQYTRFCEPYREI